MTALLPFIAAFLQAGSFAFDKAILNIRRISWKTYIAVSYPLLFVVDAVIFFIVRPPFGWHLFTGIPGALVLTSIGMLIITNLLYYRALKDDLLTEMQTLGLLNQVPVILVGFILFSDERRIVPLIAALVASLAVFWSHWEHHKMNIRPRTLPFIIWLLISTPILASFAKVILAAWNPIVLEMVRDGATALILFPLFVSSIRDVPRRGWFMLFATNILSATAWILYFTGYKTVGIVYTVLVFSLMPLLTYFFSVAFLNEPLVKKKLIAFLVVLASIATAQFLR